MLQREFVEKIEEIYLIICEKERMQKGKNEQQGIPPSRIPFEDIDLETELDKLLIPILPHILRAFSSQPLTIRKKIYKIYIATLCEISKFGFAQGGILKTIEARMGIPLNIPQHYKLLRLALHAEGIEVLYDRGHRIWEETIINEAGIPRKYYKNTLDFFKIYWKWLHRYSTQERFDFLYKFINNEDLDMIYIPELSDIHKFKALRDSMSDFKEKVLKTCKRLDMVFTLIDQFKDSIDENNIETICKDISTRVGFNVLAIIKSDELKKFILEYTTKVSFIKFNRILQNLPSNEIICLPNGTNKTKATYRYEQFLGGDHIIRDIRYHVSYPIALSIEDFYKLPRQSVLPYGNYIIYTSDEVFDVEIDEYQKTIRTFINSGGKLLYVYADRIPPAAYVYIDGQPIANTNTFKQTSYISKYWDLEEHSYRLCYLIREFRYADKKNSMKPFTISLNGLTTINGQTNSNGFFGLPPDRVVDIGDLEVIKRLTIQFAVEPDLFFEEKTIELEPYYIWGKQSGLRIRDSWELEQWYGNHNVIVFSRNAQPRTSFNITYLYQTQGYYVFEGALDPAAEHICFEGDIIPIIKSSLPYITLISDFDIIDEKRCLANNRPIAVHIENLEKADGEIIIQIEHEAGVASYNLKNIDEGKLKNIQSLFNSQGDTTGNWTISIYYEGKKVNDINVVVMPVIRIEPVQTIYAEGSKVMIKIVTGTPCFDKEGEYVSEKVIDIGIAELKMIGNLVQSKKKTFTCYIDICNVNLPLEYIPPVWAIRCLTNVANQWVDTFESNISYLDLDTQEYFICSTAATQLQVLSEEKSRVKQIVPGYSRLDLKNIFEKLHSLNQVTIKDNFGSVKVIDVRYFAQIRIGEISYEDDIAWITINYNGPINTTLSVRIFNSDSIVNRITHQITCNEETARISIKKERLDSSREITVEARTGKQEYQTIGHQTLQFERNNKYSTKFNLGTDLEIRKLLDTKLYNPEVKNNPEEMLFSLVHLLKCGGAKC